jgi:trans-2,3-dihydro-3-hydroxyanthranilate isomerase
MKEIQAEVYPYYIVDVFAEGKYEGNQLAVVLSGKNLSENKMQAIAKEMNFSETIFIISIENYEVRIFTPQAEIPFAGHPTIGAAYILKTEFIKERVKTIALNMKLGKIAVLFKYKGDDISEIWMEHKEPIFSGFFSPEILASVLNIDEGDIDGRFKIQEVSTGIPTIIVPLKNLKAIQKIRINDTKYKELIKNTQAKTILVFCPETINKKNDLHVRFFANYYGVPEDPATGSANGCLAAYLVKHEYFANKIIEIRVEQGIEIGRPSLLLLKAEEKSGKFFVSIGGRVVLVAKGQLI